MNDEHAVTDGGSARRNPPPGTERHGTDRDGETDATGADGETVASDADAETIASEADADTDASDADRSLAATEVPALGTVLVTGGGGFIGSHLVEALDRSNEVRVLDTFDTGSASGLPEAVTSIEGDVRDRALLSEALADVDVVVHLAAQVSVEDSLASPRESSETNVAATLDVLELARREDARVVLASSAAIYGDPASVPIHETDPKRPESPYGVDKLAADNYARVYGACFDVPVVVLRYFNVYGPGANAGVIQAFVERAVAGEPLTIHGDGEQTRDFVHVDDVVRATLAATTTPHTGSAYNVGTGDRVSISDVAELVRGHVEGAVPVEHTAPRAGDVEHSQAAIERARTRLGYEPRVHLDAGIESVLDSVRSDR